MLNNTLEPLAVRREREIGISSCMRNSNKAYYVTLVAHETEEAHTATA